MLNLFEKSSTKKFSKWQKTVVAWNDFSHTFLKTNLLWSSWEKGKNLIDLSGVKRPRRQTGFDWNWCLENVQETSAATGAHFSWKVRQQGSLFENVKKWSSWVGKTIFLVKNPQKVGYSLVVLKEPKYCGYGHKKVWKKNWPTKWPHVGQGGVDRATISSGPMSWKWHSKVVNFPVVCKHPWAVPMEKPSECLLLSYQSTSLLISQFHTQ